MGFLDKAKKQLTDAVDKHGDKISQGLDKAASEADRRTKGKYAAQIAKGREKAKEGLDRLDGKNDDVPPDNPPRTYPRTDQDPGPTR